MARLKLLNKMENIKEPEVFDGVFLFSNNSKEDFTVLWNNKEYTFLAMTRSPMIIPQATPEEVQEIRKKFAYKWAEREWYKSPQYRKMSKMGKGLPPTRDDKVLEPLVQMCLSPLPKKAAVVKQGKRDERTFRGSKPVDEKANLNKEFKDDVPEVLGVQSDVAPKLNETAE